LVQASKDDFAQGGVQKRAFSGRSDRFGNGESLDNNLGRFRIIGESEAFTSILETVQAIAARKCSVIITGETGSGKEMLARSIHLYSDRTDKVFVPVDCTTLTGQLFESQLFGHTKGSFTGAIDSTLGFFRAADNGTLFLDEISEIPIDLQAKLLRVIQESKVTPLGSTKSYPINIRILCATNRDLSQMVKNKEFRADLYYRLNVVTIEVPPLRQRREDILPLAEYFLNNQADFYNESHKILSIEAKQTLLEYHWPGNIRELSNAMERAYVLSTGKMIYPGVLPAEILFNEKDASGKHSLITFDDAQRKIIIHALKMTGGRKIAAAKILGLERRRLSRLIDKLDIQHPANEK